MYIDFQASVPYLEYTKQRLIYFVDLYTGVFMANINSEPYYYSKSIQDGHKDRYVLAIRDASKKSGYKKIIFYSSRKDAGIKAKELYDNYVRSTLPADSPKKREKPVTVRAACSIFMKRRAVGRKQTCQEHSIDQVTARFRNHLIPFLGEYRLSNIAVEEMTAYRNNLQKKGLSDKTIQYCIDEAKEFFSYCVELGWMERTPFDSTFKMPRPKPKKNRISGNIEDYRKMLMKGWKNPVNHAVSMVCFFTGMRVSEIRALKKDDFEPFYNQPESDDCVVIHIRHNLTNKNKEKSPKNGRERLAVIPRWVYEFILPVFSLSRTKLCFSNTAGKRPISIDKNLKNFRKELAEITGESEESIKEVGIDFHSLRKMFNSMMTGTLSSDIRRAVLGWTSENVALEHYFQILPVHYQKILNAQKVLFEEESVEWFKVSNILELSNEHRSLSKEE